MDGSVYGGVELEASRELEIRLKSGYSKGFSQMFSFPSRPLEALLESDFNFEHANSNEKARNNNSVNSKLSRLFFLLSRMGKNEAKRNEECYYFNGKYWRKIVFMFIVMQKKRFFCFSFSQDSSILHFFFFLPPKLLFIIISPCFFFFRFSRAKMGFNFFFTFFGMSGKFMCAPEKKILFQIKNGLV